MTNLTRSPLFVSLLLIASLVTAGAEEKYGVTVYPGARLDSTATEFLKQISPEAACYRTGDSLVKVIEFYKKQQGYEFIGGDNESGMLRKGGVDVTIQSPWMDMKTGKMIKDTLISIIRLKE